jgi:integrase
MLNDREIKAAIRAGKPVTLTDGTGERGAGRLALRVRALADGARGEWCAIWWQSGARKLAVIARYPDLSLAAARDIFRAEWRPAILEGIDPRHARNRARTAGTVADLFGGYIQSMKERGRRSWPEVERALLTGKGCAADALGRDLRAAAVTPDAVAAFLAAVYGRGARTAADRARAYIAAAFSWGMRAERDYTRAAPAARHFALTANPVGAVPRDHGATRARDRALTPEELGALWRALDGPGFDRRTVGAVRLVICTGARVREVLRAAARDFDLAAEVWNVPADKSKTGRGRVVPLTPQAVAAVRDLLAVTPSGLLFPNERRPGEPIADQTVNRALRRWQAAAGAEPFQARDLRRTFTTLAADAGISREARNLIQGHAAGLDRRHYDRSEGLTVTRPAILAWGRRLSRMIRGDALLLVVAGSDGHRP